MAEEMDEKFFSLILNFQTSAMVSMGKIRNPMTNELKRNLKEAQYFIDMLQMLRDKTNGNLSKKESEFFQKVLRELQMNYVDEASKKEESVPENVEQKEDDGTQDESGDPGNSDTPDQQ